MIQVPERFNIRIYGLLINEFFEVLIAHEKRHNLEFSKFPGGGLEFGEGISDCLKREFLEETGIKVNPSNHFYTNDFFQKSAFNPKDQLISMYYFVESDQCENIPTGIEVDASLQQIEIIKFEWINFKKLSGELFKFPVDQLVAEKLRNFNF